MSATTLRIAAAPRACFDYLADPRNRPQWQSSLRSVEVLTDGPPGIGTRWIDRTSVGAAPRLEITEMAPPAVTASASSAGVWTEVGRWRGLTASLTLTFAPVEADPTATDVGVAVGIAGTGPWSLPAVILRRLSPPAIRADLRRAAALIEARDRAGG